MIYIEFGVVLIAEQIDPNTVEESFLRKHSIIKDDEVVIGTPILTPIYSSLIFQNHLSIAGEGNRLLFIQRGDSLATDANRCVEVASKFLAVAPIPRFTAAGINFKGVIPRLEGNGNNDSTRRFFKHQAEWGKFQNIMPELSFKATYRDEEKNINLNIQRASKPAEPEFSGELYSANFHRDLDFTNIEQTRSHVTELLSNWRNDLEEFDQIITNLSDV